MASDRQKKEKREKERKKHQQTKIEIALVLQSILLFIFSQVEIKHTFWAENLERWKFGEIGHDVAENSASMKRMNRLFTAEW